MEKKEETLVESTLEQETGWEGSRLFKYQGFWYPHRLHLPTLSLQNHDDDNNDDDTIILASFPKSGTTWLKALAFSIANRHIYPDVDQTPLLTSNPHQLVPFIEIDLHLPHPERTPASPRMFATHIPFQTLPGSIRGSRIIYVCRNPLDHLTSNHRFMVHNGIADDAAESLELCVDKFCEGVFACGPFWDHVLGYWNAHLENPEKVLFLKYEDMKADITSNVKKIGEFMGCPFTPEKEGRGVIGEIVRLCSFENLKNVEVNKNGYVLGGLVKNSSYFRKGQVGDWINHLTPAMAERVRKLVEIKFQGSGLTFNNI